MSELNKALVLLYILTAVPSVTPCIDMTTVDVCTGGRLRSATQHAWIQRERVVVDVEFRCRTHARTEPDGSRGGGRPMHAAAISLFLSFSVLAVDVDPLCCQ